MKLSFTVVALVAALTFAYAPESQAASCSRAATVTSSLWSKYGDVVTHMGCTVAAAASQGAVDAIACVQRVGKYDASVEQMLGYWNTMAAGSWAEVGPRRWRMDTAHKGKVLGTSGRMFVMPAPSADDSFHVDFRKTAGKAKTSVTVCRVAPNGSETKVWDFEIPAGASNTGKTWRKQLPETKGYIYTAHIDGKSAAKSLSYELEAH